MISLLSKVQIIDNSGGLIGRCIKILKPLKKHATIGDLVLVSLIKTTITKDSTPGKVKKGDVMKAVVVRTKYPANKNDISWDSNAVVLVKPAPSRKGSDLTPIGTRIKGPISSSLKYRNGCQKIISLAKVLI